MWHNFKEKIWEYRGIFFAAPSVTVIVLLLRFMGILQLLELTALDQLFILRPQEAKDSRIVIVDIDELAVGTLGKRRQWPLPDGVLAQALNNLKQQNPSQIGLDLYRDFPIEPGSESLTEIFESTPNLIGVQKVAENEDSFGVAAPPILKQRNQVGSNDLPLDIDGKVRRGVFYLSDKQRKNIFSFSLKLANGYLKEKGIKTEQTKDYLIKSGNVIFPLFKGDDGGYIRAYDQGYQVLINYRGSIDKFSRVSFMDVLENRVPKEEINGKIVLIGTTAESLKDIFYTPYSNNLLLRGARRMAGITIHANATSQILSAVLDNRPLIKTWSEPLEWSWVFIWSLIGATLSWKQRHSKNLKQGIFLGTAYLLISGGVLVGIAYFAFLGGWWIPVAPSLLGLAGSTIAVTAYIAQTAGKIRQTFGRYLNDEVVASLLEHPEGLKLGGQRRKITILTSDLRGFTSTAERLPAEEVIKIINLYLGYMADVITEYQGTIDEFMGDGILVLFGAPTSREDDAKRAVACAVAMQQAMIPVNEKMAELGLPKLLMGVGINTGEVVVGNIGSEKRTKYGVVGSQVNLTYRIESYTVAGQILISESTLQEAGEEVQILGKKEVQPKGVNQPISIFDVGGIAGKYNLYLTKEEENFFALSQPLSLEYAILDGKDVSDSLLKGRLVQLSEKGAEICCEDVNSSLKPKPLTNLKMTIYFPDFEHAVCQDVYGKVVEKDAKENSFYIAFTNLPPTAETQLAKVYQSVKK